jgi:hypothetical protein
MDEQEKAELLQLMRKAFAEKDPPDANMLRRVTRLRELAVELDRELAALEYYFTGSAEPPPRG